MLDLDYCTQLTNKHCELLHCGSVKLSAKLNFVPITYPKKYVR
jgi:hypothetical protein